MKFSSTYVVIAVLVIIAVAVVVILRYSSNGIFSKKSASVATEQVVIEDSYASADTPVSITLQVPTDWIWKATPGGLGLENPEARAVAVKEELVYTIPGGNYGFFHAETYGPYSTPIVTIISIPITDKDNELIADEYVQFIGQRGDRAYFSRTSKQSIETIDKVTAMLKSVKLK